MTEGVVSVCTTLIFVECYVYVCLTLHNILLNVGAGALVYIG